MPGRYHVINVHYHSLEEVNLGVLRGKPYDWHHLFESETKEAQVLLEQSLELHEDFPDHFCQLGGREALPLHFVCYFLINLFREFNDVLVSLSFTDPGFDERKTLRKVFDFALGIPRENPFEQFVEIS